MTHDFRSGTHSFDEVYQDLTLKSNPVLDYFVLMALASTIASFGLLLNSAAVVIGAMLVSPLMDPILGVAFSSFIRDFRFRFRASVTLMTGVILAIGVSYVIGLLFNSVGMTPEILARTKPNIMDLLVALSAGFLGGYVKVRKSVSGTIYGVAIAISLVPPLAVVGLGLSINNFTVYSGAALLFLTNLCSIFLSSLLAFTLINIPAEKRSFKWILVPAISISFLALPLVFSFITLVQEKQLNRELRTLIQERTYTFQKMQLVDVQSDLFQRPALVTLMVRAVDPELTPRQVKLVQDYLSRQIGREVKLTVLVSAFIQVTAEGEPEDER